MYLEASDPSETCVLPRVYRFEELLGGKKSSGTSSSSVHKKTQYTSLPLNLYSIYISICESREDTGQSGRTLDPKNQRLRKDL
jgi:hypothetical protein